MPRLIVIACLILAGCGADGPPQAPTEKTESGITLTGDVQLGVVSK